VTLGVAFVGCGRISDLHALGYQRTREARIQGVFDVDPARAEAKARAWGVARVYRSFEEVVGDPTVDLVEILTPHHLHCEMTVAAAEAGKNVSVQKPMALTLEEADRMVAAARRAGVVLRIYENFVFYPPFVKARQLLETGEIGEPISFNLRVRTGFGRRAWDIPGDAWAWRFNPATCGGGPLMFDHGYHNFSLAIYMLGRPDRVSAWIGATEIFPGAGLTVDAPAAVWWTYGSDNRPAPGGQAGGGRQPGGGPEPDRRQPDVPEAGPDVPRFGVMDVVHTSELAIDTEYYGDEARLEITGTKGVIFVNRMTGKLQNRAPVELYRDGVTTAFEHVPSGWEESFSAATLDLVEALAAGRESRLTGERGREVLAFTLAAHRSAREGRIVEVE